MECKPVGWSHPEGLIVFRQSLMLPVCVALCVATSAFIFEMGGQLIVSEVLLLMCSVLCVCVDWRGVARLPSVRLWMGAVLLGLIAYSLADIVNGSNNISLFKGAARWVMFGGSAIAISYAFALYRKAPELIALGAISSGLWSGMQYYNESGWAWKFGFGEPLTLLLILVSGRSSRLVAVALCFLAAVLNLFMDYRSLAGACLVCCAFHVLRGRRLASGSKVFAVGVALVLVVVGGFLYKILIVENDTRFSRSTDSNEIRLTGIKLGVKAIRLSPWFGHGTWASDPELLLEYSEMLQDSRLLRGDQLIEEKNINTAIVGEIHSQILQGGAEAGLLGLVTFFIIGYVLIRSFIYIFSKTDFLNSNEVVCVFYLALSIWAEFSSPFAGNNRILMALGIAAAVRVLVIKRQAMFGYNARSFNLST